MKTLLKKSIPTTLALIFVFTTVSSFANPNGEKDTEKLSYSINAIPNSNKIVLGVKKEDPGKLAVKIYDDEGNLLYTDKFSDTQGMRRTYDLSETGPGDYTVKIIAGKVYEIKRVTVGQETSENRFKAYFTSKFRDNKIKVSYYHAAQPAQVTVFDNSGKAIFRNVISEKEDFSSFINLSKLQKGDYLVRVDSDGKGIEKSVTVK